MGQKICKISIGLVVPGNMEVLKGEKNTVVEILSKGHRNLKELPVAKDGNME